MDKIALATTGGDAPGMNAAIRALTRLAISYDLDVIGYENGWDGLDKDNYQILTKRSVGGILHQGGTILRTSRTDVLRTEEGRENVADNLRTNNVDGLVVIGGNGSFRAAQRLQSHIDIPFIGIPATIDNDVYGTEETIGFDTAVNTAVHELDKIRDTATSHNRIFITEVMGRNNGFIALDVGIAVGASAILVPEEPADPEAVIKTIKRNAAKGKNSGIIVTAEGVDIDCRELKTMIEDKIDSTVRINILGYTQRGGSPTARSRLIANLFAKEGIDQLLTEPSNQITYLEKGEFGTKPMKDIVGKKKDLEYEMLDFYRVLAS